MPRCPQNPAAATAAIPCTFYALGCTKTCRNKGGLTQHEDQCTFNPKNCYDAPPLPERPSDAFFAAVNGDSTSQQHPNDWKPLNGAYVKYHPHINGTPCPPPHQETVPPVSANPFAPFGSAEEFRITEITFTEDQMSAKTSSELFEAWQAYNTSQGSSLKSPFANTKDLYGKIDAIPFGDVPWKAFSIQYTGDLPHKPSSWMKKEFHVYYRDPLAVLESQLANPDFATRMDYAPKHVHTPTGKRLFKDLFSGTWAWDQADELAEDPANHGAMFTPVVLGSDKTTVSVATGQNDYYPLYASLGNLHNDVRRAHCDSMTVIGFLAIPKTEKKHEDSLEFRTFRRQLFHSSLVHILRPLQPWMTKGKVTRCGDGKYRRVIYGIGPYIADYPEQCLLAGIVGYWCCKCTAPADALDDFPDQYIMQSHKHTELVIRGAEGNEKKVWKSYGIISNIKPFTMFFPRANIHELLAPDLLHQLIKGTFKDHLVEWVNLYIKKNHSKQDAQKILSEIDRRIAIAPPFPGLRRFPEGRGFSQWTGNDSKALMKVYVPALVGLVPDGIIRALTAFLDFCYLVRRSEIDEDMLDEIDHALERFDLEREIFIDLEVRSHLCLPRQHSRQHYPLLIRMFGAPNGLCSSITESQHIRSVKEPWRRSNHNRPLLQMLKTNVRMSKLSAFRTHLESQGFVLRRRNLGSEIPFHGPTSDNDDFEVENGVVAGLVPSEADVRLPANAVTGYPKDMQSLIIHLALPSLKDAIRRFLYDQFNPDSKTMGMAVNLSRCPKISNDLQINLYHHAISLFRAPSDVSGINCMRREFIRANPNWRNDGSRYDCVLVDVGAAEDGFRTFEVAQVKFFFAFTYKEKLYECAYVHWFEHWGDGRCDVTGMWRVVPQIVNRNQRLSGVIHLDTIFRAVHLMPVRAEELTPEEMRPSDTLSAFPAYYVNKFADHLSHELAN